MGSFILSYDSFIIIQVLFSNLYVKLNLLSHIAQWNSELLISMDLYGSLISMDFSTDMNSSLVLLKLDVKLIFCHISHNVILFAVSFKANQVLSFQIQMSNQNYSCISQNEILLALSFKAMNF